MTVTINEAGMRELFGSVTSPVGNLLSRYGLLVEMEAKRITGSAARSATRPRRRTGDLNASIGSFVIDGTPTPGMPSGGVEAIVSAGDVRTASHHDSDYPSRLELGGIAHFRWRRGPRAGRPGTKAYKKPYLVPALRAYFSNVVVHRHG